jgi:hypothetical protein
MAEILSRNTKAPVEALDDVEEDETDRNIKQAVWDAIRKHKENGNPVAIWEDGNVKIVQPEDIVLPDNPQGNEAQPRSPRELI